MWYNKGVDLLTVSVTARESAGEPYTLVEVTGEADVTNTDELRRLLDEEVSQQPRMLIIDLSGLRFMDSSALHALLRVNRSMDRQGGVLALVSPQPAVAKILRLTTADRLIPVFASVAEPPRTAEPRKTHPDSVFAERRDGICSSPVVPTTQARSMRHGVFAERADRGTTFLRFRWRHRDPTFVSKEAPRMKIALVAQHATPLSPRAGSGPESDDIGLSELTRKLADHGHKVTIYAQKHQPDLPDRAELGDGVRVEHIDAGPVPEAPADGKQDDSGLLDRVPAFSGPLRSSWEQERPDIVHALRWTSGLAALAAARDHHIPVVQAFSSLGVTEPRGLASG